MGGLASETTRFSAVCLSTEDDPHVHPTVMALIISACAIPILSFIFMAAFWTMVTVFRRVGRPLSYLAVRCMLSIMVLWYLTAVSVLKTAFSTVLCIAVNDSKNYAETKEVSYWAVDTSLECFKDDHLMLTLLMTFFVVVIYGGLLIFFVLALGSAEERLTDGNSWFYQIMGFLYRSYKLGKRRYWEVAITLRKVIIAFLIFCAQRFDSQIPIIGVAGFITVATIAHIAAMPYRKRFHTLNRIEIGSLFTSLITTLITASLKSTDSLSQTSIRAATAACGLLNVTVFLVFVYLLSEYAAVYLKLLLIENGTVSLECDWGMSRVFFVWLKCEINRLMPFF